MRSKSILPDLLTRQLRGREIADVAVHDRQRLKIDFTDGTMLTIEVAGDELKAAVSDAKQSARDRDATARPTKRQLEYLAFIARYVKRFGMAPAEADIAQHFLVSPPTVNQMMQMLERRGFIVRQPGVARSIRLCIGLPAER